MNNTRLNSLLYSLGLISNYYIRLVFPAPGLPTTTATNDDSNIPSTSAFNGTPYSLLLWITFFSMGYLSFFYIMCSIVNCGNIKII